VNARGANAAHFSLSLGRPPIRDQARLAKLAILIQIHSVTALVSFRDLHVAVRNQSFDNRQIDGVGLRGHFADFVGLEITWQPNLGIPEGTIRGRETSWKWRISESAPAG